MWTGFADHPAWVSVANLPTTYEAWEGVSRIFTSPPIASQLLNNCLQLSRHIYFSLHVLLRVGAPDRNGSDRMKKSLASLAVLVLSVPGSSRRLGRARTACAPCLSLSHSAGDALDPGRGRTCECERCGQRALRHDAGCTRQRLHRVACRRLWSRDDFNRAERKDPWQDRGDRFRTRDGQRCRHA